MNSREETIREKIRAKYLRRIKDIIEKSKHDRDIKKVDVKKIVAFMASTLKDYGKPKDPRDWNGETSQLCEGIRSRIISVDDFRQLVEWVNTPGQAGSFFLPRLFDRICNDLKRGEVWPIFSKPDAKPKEYYTKKEAAEILGVSVRRIEDLVYEDKLKYLPTGYNRKNKRVILGKVLTDYLKEKS